MMSDTEDSEVLEIDVRGTATHSPATVSSGVRLRSARRTLVAPPPPKLIPQGNCGVSIWVLVLLDKYSSYRPTERLLGQLEQYDLDLPGGTINDGLQRIEPMLQPNIYHVNRERLQHPLDSVKFQEHDALLRCAVEAMQAEAVTELSNPKLRQPCRKVLESLQETLVGTGSVRR